MGINVLAFHQPDSFNQWDTICICPLTLRSCVHKKLLPALFLFLLINQTVGSKAVDQPEARAYMALRLLYQEPRAKRGRRRNKEGVIMDGTSLWMIEAVVAFLGVFALHFIWK
jgi:hypothetical protein